MFVLLPYLEMIWVEPGSFKMGGQQSQHSVQLTKGFYLGKFEVTQREHASVMNIDRVRLARRNSSIADLFQMLEKQRQYWMM